MYVTQAVFMTHDLDGWPSLFPLYLREVDKLILCRLDQSATKLLFTTEIPSAEWRDPENACSTIQRQGIL